MKNLIHGVLPDRQIRNQLIDTGILRGADVNRIQPASIDIMPDLNTVMKLNHFTLPRRGERVVDLIAEMRRCGVVKDMKNDLTLQTDQHYIVRMNESFKKLFCFARANPKSSIGRLFMHSRLLCDRANTVDEISFDYSGDIWTLLAPKFFPVTLHETEAMNQLRFFSGDARLSDHELRRILHSNPLLVTRQDHESIPVEVTGSTIGEIPVSVDLKGKCYRTKRGITRPLGLNERGVPSSEYWEEIDPEEMKNGLILEQGRGYIIGTVEQFQIPENMAVEVIISDRYGEIRLHFAGFVDPKFGLGIGNSITLEIVCHERGLCLRHGQYVGTVRAEWMTEKPEKGYQGSYIVQERGGKLAKYFSVV